MNITKKQLKRIIKEELIKEAGRPHSMRGGRTMADLDKDAKTRETDFLKTPSGRGAMSQADTNAAKGAAMALLDVAKAMEQAPSHDSASRYAMEVAKQANLIMDSLVSMGT